MNITADKLIGKPVYDMGLHKVGKISHLYLDQNSRQPTWATVKTGFFGNKESFVPLSLAEMDEEDDEIIVRTEKDVITDAPNIEPEGELSPEEQIRLYSYYRDAIENQQADDMQADHAATEDDRDTADSEQTAEADKDMAATDDNGATITRHEEELQVGKTTQEAGRVHLRKYVVTENATITIPLVREKVRIEREPITDDNQDDIEADQESSEATQEIVLHEEVPVVHKQTVAKERVRLSKEQETRNQEVNDEVRKEQIDPVRDDTDQPQ